MRSPFNRLISTTAALLAAVTAGTVSPAAAAEPGPALQTPTATLQQAVSCTADLAGAATTPVLLVHGTYIDSAESWGWGYQRVLAAQGYPVCTVELPQRATIDMQTSVEYVVHAIRHANEVSGRRVAVIGHSQGAILPVWALRFWPDLAARVDDMIGLAGPMDGAGFANDQCALGTCPDVTDRKSVV